MTVASAAPASPRVFDPTALHVSPAEMARLDMMYRMIAQPELAASDPKAATDFDISLVRKYVSAYLKTDRYKRLYTESLAYAAVTNPITLLAVVNRIASLQKELGAKCSCGRYANLVGRRGCKEPHPRRRPRARKPLS